MKGHNDLIKMRISGKKPASVTIYDYPFDTDWTTYGDLPRVCVHGDAIVDLDLRFVVGLTVFIESNNEARADHLLEKCIAMGATIVAASSYFSPQQDPYSKTASKSRLFFKDFGGQIDNHHHARFD